MTTPPSDVRAEVLEALHDVIAPELGVDVADLGLVYDVTFEPDGTAVVAMTLTTAACPLTDVIEEEVDLALRDVVAAHRIEWVWSPPWTVRRVTPEGREQLHALGFRI